MKFTKKETSFLDCLNKCWKYIARDKDGTLYLFEDRPVKETDYYDSEDGYICIGNIVRDDLFKCVTFDGGPVRISKEILDDAEKRYLSAVIKPFRDRVAYIIKASDDELKRYFIKIQIITNGVVESILLPYFDGNTMYKGMELGRGYTLKELGL